jgi:hypothetical protein
VLPTADTIGLSGDELAVLKRRFQAAEDKSDKQRLAVELVVRSADDDEAIQFLIAHAERAIEDGLPYPFVVSESGEYTRNASLPEFLEWCSSQGLHPAAELKRATVDLPGDVLFLAMSGDTRGYDVLMEGLRSENPMIAYESARGLNNIGDPRAIIPIMEVVEATRSPSFKKLTAREGLVGFDDPRADEMAVAILGQDGFARALDRHKERSRAYEAAP